MLFVFPILQAFSCPSGQEIPGQYLVRLKEAPNSLISQKALPALEEIQFIHRPGTSKGVRGKLGSSWVSLAKVKLDQAEALSAWMADPQVLSLESDCWVQTQSQPNDEHFHRQLHHNLIESSKAWETKTRSSIVVAISDTGVDHQHPDLIENMWQNPMELSGVPGKDDDDNGCVDDIYGCDLADKDGDPRPDNSEALAHGTHVAGVLAARGNNDIGVTGVAWSLPLMAVKGFSDGESDAKLSDLLATVYYAVDNGAKIVNCSWGTEASPSLAEIQTFDYAKDQDVLVVVAAGNGQVDVNSYSPASLSSVLSVGSINSGHQLSGFSNYGNSLDILAPGGDSSDQGGIDEKIFSTYPVNLWSYSSDIGTSVAAPQVSAVAALIWSLNPHWKAQDVKGILIDSSKSISVSPPSDDNLTFELPHLNAGRALAYAQDHLGNQKLGDNQTDEISEAINSGMGGCGLGAMESKASLPSLLILLLCLAFPLLLSISKR